MKNLYCIQPLFLITVIGLLISSLSLFAAPAEPNNHAQSKPVRIASINLCIDQLLWQLVPHDRLVSISYLSAEPLWSPIASQVGAMHLNHGLAEEIMPLKADIILAMPFDSPAAIELLKRLDAPVEMVLLPNSLTEIPEHIIQLARVLGEEANGELLIEKINKPLQALDEVKQNTQVRTAFWYSSNGLVIGSSTLEHELMMRAGLRNLAAEQGIHGFTPLDIELLIAAKPELLIIEESRSDVFSLAREYLAHPALTNASIKIIRLPSGLSGCAASTVAEVADVLERELRE